MKRERCETCWAWRVFPEHYGRPGTGACHRKAPVGRDEDIGKAIWPMTALSDFCGEWDDRAPERKVRSL